MSYGFASLFLLSEYIQNDSVNSLLYFFTPCLLYLSLFVFFAPLIIILQAFIHYFLLLFLSPSRQIPGQYIKFGHDRFLPRTF
jgi:hypothetical protein